MSRSRHLPPNWTVTSLKASILNCRQRAGEPAEKWGKEHVTPPADEHLERKCTYIRHQNMNIRELQTNRLFTLDNTSTTATTQNKSELREVLPQAVNMILDAFGYTLHFFHRTQLLTTISAEGEISSKYLVLQYSSGETGPYH